MPSWVLAVEVDFRSGYGNKGGTCQKGWREMRGGGMGKMGRGEERMGNSVTARGQVIQWVPREFYRRIISEALIYC